MLKRPKHLFGSPEVIHHEPGGVLTDLMEAMRLGKLAYGRFELAAPWGIQLPHDAGAFIIVVGLGSAQLEVIGMRTALALSSGDLVVLPRGGAHRLRDAKGSALRPLQADSCERIRMAKPIELGGTGRRTTLVIAAFQFRPAHQALLRRLAHSIHISATDPAAPPWLAPTVQHLIAESCSASPGARVMVNRLADVLLVQAIRRFIAGRECSQHGLRALRDRHIAHALTLLHDRYSESWTLERLATAVGLSRSGFAARFDTLVGESPLKYLARWRMTQAAMLLRETDLAMGTVAERVGYRSEASFNKAFKRLEGVTPGSYRRRNRMGVRM